MTSQASSDKRAEIKKNVWNSLYDKEELTIPTLPYNNIPNFKSLDAAIEKLLELDVVKGTDRVLLSMEKCMNNLRTRMLQEKSMFYVMTYKNSVSTVLKVDMPTDQSNYSLRQAANLYDREKVQAVEAGEVFDVLVVSSIAVSSKGERMGKSDTLGSLEYPILSFLGFVGPSTKVVTLVHDLQVLDDVSPAPHHNLPVDLIITPTRVIECEKRARADKIKWSALSEEAVNDFVVLKNLRYTQWKDGENVCCEGQSENPAELEEVVVRKAASGRRLRGARKTSYNERKEGAKSDGRRRKVSGKENGESDGGMRSGGEKRGGGGFGRRTRRRYFNSSRQFSNNDDFKPAVYVGDLPTNMTSEAFSDLLASKNVHPPSVFKAKDTTHGFAIFEKGEDVNTQLSSLEGLSIEDKPLKIELSRQTARRQKTQQ